MRQIVILVHAPPYWRYLVFRNWDRCEYGDL